MSLLMIISLLPWGAISADAATQKDIMDMFRLYDPNSGEHFYTGSEEERENLVAVGWNYEGVGFTFPLAHGKPVYRLYDPVYGEHLYTMNEAEKVALEAAGWNFEGIAFNSADEDAVPQYRLHNPNETRGAYHFTASFEERDYLLSLGWEYQGIGWYSVGAKPHVHSYTSEVIAPTTDSQGYTLHTCICGDSFKDNYTDPIASSFSIHFIDVGQADAALVECNGHYMLIDGGNKADSNVIYSVLARAGVSKLDIVVGTHAHEDHIGGLPGAYNYCSANLKLCPVTSYDSEFFEDFARYANLNGNGITVPSAGDTYSLGSATVKILGVNGGSGTNDTSIVLRIDYGETSFLFTGDAEHDAEQTILNSGADLSATVLKVGHHGSDTSTTYPFLREIMPQYAVISVGTINSYGHPTEEALSRLRDADVTVFRTDLQGDVYCSSDGKTVTFSVSRNADADVFGGIGNNSPKPEPGETTPPEASCPVETEPPATDPEPGTGTNMVWIPKSGSKYHSYSSCSNMKNPSQVTEAEAQAMGYTPCKRCH